MFKFLGKVGSPGGQYDQPVNMAVHQRFDALDLRGLIAADAESTSMTGSISSSSCAQNGSVAVGITSPMVLVTVLRNALAA